MRLHRLRLENWKAVEHRELEFGAGVTLVEGPNESGKSTLLEALTLLFEEYDSSTKQAVRDVQPAGRDVGSLVCAEVETGPYRFVYRKVFNRQRRTELEVRAPERRQLTGREAHQAVQAMLAETVDLALWRTLLVVQGQGWTAADLRQSQALARALDTTAGTTGGRAESEAAQASLAEAVSAEYGRYFTEKQGKPRFGALLDAHAQAREALEQAEAALAEVADDTVAWERQHGEVARLETQLPGLREDRARREAQWQQARQVEERAAAGRRQLAAAEALLDEARARLEDRRRLAEELELRRRECEAAAAELTPAQESQQQRYAAREQHRRRLGEARRRQREAQEALQQAAANAEEWQRRATMEALGERLARLEAVDAARRTQRQLLADNSIDDAVLSAYRDADTDLTSARRQRDAAAPRLRLAARRPQTIVIDGESYSVSPGTDLERLVQKTLRLTLPDSLELSIEPSYSATELQDAVDDAAAALAALADRHGPADLASAIEAGTRRAAAEQRLAQLDGELAGLLGKDSKVALEAQLEELRAASARYGDGRRKLPESLAAAGQALTEAREALAAAEQLREAAERTLEHSAGACEAGEAELQQAQQQLVALRAAVADREAALARARAQQSDDALAAQREARRREADGQRTALAALEASLAEAAPDQARLLFDNASAACSRSEAELAEARKALAVLSDRLSRARADGRYDAREAAERRWLALDDELTGTRRRAAAAARLFETLTRHRDAARRAYAEPLTAAIERLGRLVFGADFAVALDEDWSIASRTLGGTTLPFEALSLGAQEQLGILSRLAAAELVAQDEGVPLIIDDALGYSDPERLQTMGAAIAAVGRTCQIIVLTCTPGRYRHVGEARSIRF